jgi:hypothetical protein
MFICLAYENSFRFLLMYVFPSELYFWVHGLHVLNHILVNEVTFLLGFSISVSVCLSFQQTTSIEMFFFWF